MKRRNFIQTAGGASIASLFPGLWMSDLMAADDPFDGTILMSIFAGGGWDQSSFSDPRNNTAINHWARGGNNAKSIGKLKYAPWVENEEFFRKYYRDILVFNGMDLQTGGHGAANQNQITGKLSNYPSVHALYAAIKGVNLPIPFLASRVDGYTQGVQPFTTLPDAAGLRRMTSSNIRDANSVYYRSSDLEIINRFRIERINRLAQGESLLPYTQRKMEEMAKAATDRGLMGRLADAIPNQLDTTDLKGRRHRTIEKLHTMLIAAGAGVNVASDVRTGANFDSHKSHDANHQNGLTELVRSIDYVWEKAKDLGIDNRLCLVVYSDVGRTPRYNGNAGKDHWQNGSAMIMMKNQPWTNRVVGVSGPAHQKVNINPTTLQPVSSGGVRLKTEHFQAALREILGIQNHPLCQKYPVDNVPPIDVLNPRYSSPINA